MSKLQRIENILLFLTLLFLPTQLGRHFWPRFAYIYSLKIDYLSPTIYFWDLLVIALLVVWILRKPKVHSLALSVFLFFMLTQALSIIGAENVGAGLVRLEQYGLAGSLGVFLASSGFKSLSKMIYRPLILATVGVSLIAILQFCAGTTLGLWILGERNFSITTPGIAKFDFYGMQFLRPYATFPHPNVLAAFIIISVIILMGYYLKKTYSSLVIFLSGLTVFLTMGRAAIFAGFIALLVFLRRKWLILTIVLLLVISPVLFTRFSSLLSFDNLTLIRREQLFANAWQIFLKQPFFGAGLNNFIPEMAGNLVTGPNRFLQPVHNIFLLVLSETGIIGLIGWMCLIGFPLLKFLRLYLFEPEPQSRRPKLYPLTPFFLPWFIILFLGMFDHYFLTLPQGYRLLFLIWGLSFSVLE